jgi:hypothetical protein
MGFEPTYERVTVVCVNRFTTATIKYFGTPERIRTSDLRIRSPLLYPTELQAQSLVGVRGFEPPTPCSQGRCASQAALHPVETQIFTISAKQLQLFFIRLGNKSELNGYNPVIHYCFPVEKAAFFCSRWALSLANALPRWLILFFRSRGSSASVLLYSGKKNKGS